MRCPREHRGANSCGGRWRSVQAAWASPPSLSAYSAPVPITGGMAPLGGSAANRVPLWRLKRENSRGRLAAPHTFGEKPHLRRWRRVRTCVHAVHMHVRGMFLCTRGMGVCAHVCGGMVVEQAITRLTETGRKRLSFTRSAQLLATALAQAVTGTRVWAWASEEEERTRG